jgi:hypothetical protein
MSAYVVSDLHINTLVSWAAKNKVCVYSPHQIAIAEEPARVAGILYTANVESVNHRYSEDDVSIGFTFKLVTKQPDALTIIKLCHCLAYQSNEVPEYDRTIGAAIISAIQDKAIRALPGYDDAPWGI